MLWKWSSFNSLGNIEIVSYRMPLSMIIVSNQMNESAKIELYLTVVAVLVFAKLRSHQCEYLYC